MFPYTFSFLSTTPNQKVQHCKKPPRRYYLDTTGTLKSPILGFWTPKNPVFWSKVLFWRQKVSSRPGFWAKSGLQTRFFSKKPVFWGVLEVQNRYFRGFGGKNRSFGLPKWQKVHFLGPKRGFLWFLGVQTRVLRTPTHPQTYPS